MKKVVATLRLEVTYLVPAHEDTKVPKEILLTAVEFLAGSGLLTGESALEVAGWSTEVKSREL